MEPNPLPAPPDSAAAANTLRLCQACGEPAVLQTHEDGAPTLLDGHYTRDCDHLSDYVCSFQSSVFGIVVPDQSQSIIWQFQTGGLMCNTRNVRGCYIPLTPPMKRRENIDYRKLPADPGSNELYIKLPGQLAAGNYQSNTSEEEVNLDPVWRMIDEELPFTYEPADAPTGYPETEEAWKWIRITGITRSIHEESDADRLLAGTDVTPLVGERVVLVYPNSD